MSETTERDIFCSWKSPIWTRDFISSQNDLRYESHRQTLKTTCENYCSQEPFLGTHFLQPKWSETGLAALGMEGYFSHRRTNNQTQPEPRSGPTLTFQGIKRMEEHVKWHRGDVLGLASTTGNHGTKSPSSVTKQTPREKRKIYRSE